MAGAARRKLNLNTFCLSMPRSKPVLTVAPLREMPGIKETACAMPMSIELSDVRDLLFSRRSEANSRKPVKSRAMLTARAFWNNWSMVL